MLTTTESSTWLRQPFITHEENTNQQLLSARFQLPSIRNSSIYYPSQRTHSCCPPTNLHTLNPAPEWAKSQQNMAAGETMHDVSFESVERHFTERISPHHLSRCKGGWGEDAETKWLFLEDPLLPDEAKSFSLLRWKWLLWIQRITNTRDG